jgi:hypothetical protein
MSSQLRQEHPASVANFQKPTKRLTTEQSKSKLETLALERAEHPRINPMRFVACTGSDQFIFIQQAHRFPQDGMMLSYRDLALKIVRTILARSKYSHLAQLLEGDMNAAKD